MVNLLRWLKPEVDEDLAKKVKLLETEVTLLRLALHHSKIPVPDWHCYKKGRIVFKESDRVRRKRG